MSATLPALSAHPAPDPGSSEYLDPPCRPKVPSYVLCTRVIRSPRIHSRDSRHSRDPPPRSRHSSTFPRPLPGTNLALPALFPTVRRPAIWPSRSLPCLRPLRLLIRRLIDFDVPATHLPPVQLCHRVRGALLRRQPHEGLGFIVSHTCRPRHPIIFGSRINSTDHGKHRID